MQERRVCRRTRDHAAGNSNAEYGELALFLREMIGCLMGWAKSPSHQALGCVLLPFENRLPFFDERLEALSSVFRDIGDHEAVGFEGYP